MTDWRDRAACLGLDPLFDTVVDHREDLAAARKAVDICATCPVTQVCLDDALEEEAGLPTRGRHGIRGGLTPAERRKLDTATPADRRRSIRHGTEGGYSEHRRRGEDPCRLCREASIEARRVRAGKRGA